MVHNAASARMGIYSSHRTTVPAGISGTLHVNMLGASQAGGIRPSPKRSSTLHALHILAEFTGEGKSPKSLGPSNRGIWRPTGHLWNPRTDHAHPHHRPRRRQLSQSRLVLPKLPSLLTGTHSWKHLSPMISTTESTPLSSASTSIGSRNTWSPRRHLPYIITSLLQRWGAMSPLPNCTFPLPLPFLSIVVHILTGYVAWHDPCVTQKAVEGGAVTWWLVSASGFCKSHHHADFWHC